jgi:hypothetical protein
VRAALARIHVCAALGVAAACASPPREALVGASDAWSNAAEPSTPRAPAPSSVWDSYADAQRWPASNAAPFIARGHQPEQRVDVRVNEIARSAYSGLVADTVFPNGSLLTELPHSPLGTGGGFAIRKSAGSWSYFQLDGKGQVLASGALSLCNGCHAQALADHVFGIPH